MEKLRRGGPAVKAPGAPRSPAGYGRFTLIVVPLLSPSGSWFDDAA